VLVRAVIYGMHQTETNVDRAPVRFLMGEFILFLKLISFESCPVVCQIVPQRKAVLDMLPS